MHASLLIVGILTIGFALASFFAYVMQRLKLPSILGYLLAGYAIGPYSPGFVADAAIAEQLAEIGVILMLFGVGLHFKIEDLLRVKNIAIPGAIGQTLTAAFFTCILVYALGWTIEAGLIIGLSIGVASTVVLVRILTDNNVLNTLKGHIAVGWLVVEDILTVIVLILIPTIAAISHGESYSFLGLAGTILFVLAKFGVLALLMATWGHRAIDYILTNVARLRSQELLTLTIIAVVFVIADGSSIVFGTSIALGAFIAGMVIGKTNIRHQAASNALPLKDIFAVIFFISVGMLFNPVAIVTHFPLFLAITAVIFIIKPLVACLVTLFLGYSLNVALTVAISLAQIGEFSFILAEDAMNLNLIPEEGFDILVACALLSISLNPLLFQTIGYFEEKIQKWPLFKKLRDRPARKLREEETALQKVLIVGFGPIGKAVSKIVKDSRLAPVVIDQNIDTVSNVVHDEYIIFGDAADSNILEDAHIEEAKHLLITIPDTEKVLKIIRTARLLNPNIQIIARAQYVGEKTSFQNLNVQYICTESEALKAFVDLARQTLQPLESF